MQTCAHSVGEVVLFVFLLWYIFSDLWSMMKVRASPWHLRSDGLAHRLEHEQCTAPHRKARELALRGD